MNQLARILTIAGLSGVQVAAVGQEKGRQDAIGEAARMGAVQSDYRDRNLVETPPPRLETRLLPMDAAGTLSAFQPAPKMSTVEQMRAELRRQREMHEPFLKDLAPPLEEQRQRVVLDSFDWRAETEADRADFPATLAGKGAWERVKVPHYAGPVGRAATYYRTEFEVTPAMRQMGALFVRFKGVDYKAHVFVNGAFLGSHEGLFAPFEFEFTPHARAGKNVLLVKVVNDFTMLGNSDKPRESRHPGDPLYAGDKICAAVGPGWDEPGIGWHSCPPGMGIWQDVSVEARRRVHVHDLFVRPLTEEGKAEAWIELFSCDPPPTNVVLDLAVFGQNFPAVVLRGQSFPLQDGGAAAGNVAKAVPANGVESGVNLFKIPLSIPQPRLWSPETPWLYQLQVKLLDENGNVLDTARRQFGVRTFRMEYVQEPKGRMYLNGKGIKLRGANTMGNFQQCVIRKDWRQLTDDILLAKMTHLNYIRLTQTPVQPEVYEYCDRLGLMLQTDLPLFARVRRNQFCEVVRQAEEMERLVRGHPSNVMVTYINEPFANSWRAPHRNLTRPEMTRMFEAADMVVHMANPDRVTKAVDGDYDPPGPGLSDNHLYCAWYNNHGVEMGALHKGYWQRVKPGWDCGCGEFGVDGLDSVELMRKYYPKAWLPQTADEERAWTPGRLPCQEAIPLHADFYETPQTFADWVKESQAYQAWGVRLMAEALRRNRRMQSFALHLLIDALPDGWLMSVMDYDRQPKPAWFAFRDALLPLAVNLRSDRQAFFAGEEMDIEAWVCNDRNDAPRDARLCYQIECGGRVLQAGSTPATVPALDVAYQGTLRFQSPEVKERTAATIRLGLLDASGKVLHDTSVAVEVLPRENVPLRRIYVIGPRDGKGARLAGDLGVKPVFEGPLNAGDAILIDDYNEFDTARERVGQAVRQGARAVFLGLPNGGYRIGPTDVRVGGTVSRGPLHFVSRATGHEFVQGLRPNDFRFWYDAQLDRPSPLLRNSGFEATGWEPILLTHGAESGAWKSATRSLLAAACITDGKGRWCVCQIELAGRIAGNPVADILARRLLAIAP